MLVVSTVTLPASPTSAGTSNDSNARMPTSSISASTPGRPSRSVIERKVFSGPAPAISAASSNEASVERSTADISRKVSGAKPTPSTRIMPHIE